MRSPLNYREQTDEILVALTLTRDESAFEELVKRHQRAALLVAQNVTRNLYTAEDAVQDAFLCAWQRLDTLKDPARFGAWVCRIAKYRAINLAKRYRDYIPFDEVENYIEDAREDLSGYYDDKLETEILRGCVERLSEKIGTVIRLHYFEGLSISDIAKRTRLAEGTVKSRLAAGREQIRKELGYMDKNNANETLVEAVMRRVEEFKQWRLKNSKKGFEEDYKDVLAQVEGLPDSEKKFYAMADVLRLGYWYLSGDKTDEMREKLREAAIKGNNKDVLATCFYYDVDKYSGQERVEYVYQTLIPELLRYGLDKEVAYHHYWLGNDHFDRKEYDNARKEFNLAIETGAENPLYVALARSTLGVMDGLGEALADRTGYFIHTTSEELVRMGDKLIYNAEPGFSRGHMLDVPDYVNHSDAPLFYASRTDSLVFDESMKPGDSVTDSTGNVTLTCVSNEATVETPAGIFRNCVEMHTSEPLDWRPAPIFVAWYKRNIGLVAFGWKQPDGEVFGRTVLTAFHIEGGLGYIPMAAGNRWEYHTEGCEHEQVNRVEVTAVEGDKSYLSYCFYIKGNPFDENSWKANMLYARENYCTEKGNDHDWELVDISAYHARAAELASTPWEKKMTEVSRTVMERIFAGDLTLHPEAKQHGIWNFFVMEKVREEKGVITLYDDRVFSFEWKDGEYPRDWSVLHNFIYDIMESSMGGIWNPAWLDYADRDEKFIYRRPCRTNDYPEFIGEAIVKTGATVETRAGKFENCLHICTFSDTYEHGGRSYQCHKKDYYFADGIGLVRVKTYGGADPVYDLVAYEGTGEGYMPVREGLTRHYEYVGDEARIHAGVIYHYLKDDNGNLCVLSDQIGMIDV